MKEKRNLGVNVKSPYVVIGYDKDNDVYVCYGEFIYEKMAKQEAEELTVCMKRGLLKRECSDGTMEPIDWIEVYKNWNKDDEQVVWASYNDRPVKDDLKYRLHGMKMVEDDYSLDAFAQSIIKNLAADYQIDRANCEDADEYRDRMLDAAYDRIHNELSMTSIDYSDLLEKYAKDIGQLLYDMENHGFDLSTIQLSFFDNTSENFNLLLYNYISVHFEELCPEVN